MARQCMQEFNCIEKFKALAGIHSFNQQFVIVYHAVGTVVNPTEETCPCGVYMSFGRR